MRKKILTLILLLIVTACFSDIFLDNTAKASVVDPGTQTPLVNWITIVQNPTKTVYSKGEDLDLSGMIVKAYYIDGTSQDITDYQVVNYNNSLLGLQTVYINYQGYSASFNINVLPAKVTNVTVASNSTTSITLNWDAVVGTSLYEVYTLDALTGSYQFNSYAYTNSITLTYLPGTVQSYQICAVEYLNGIQYKGSMSDTITAATDPEMVSGLTVTGTTANSISLSWNPVIGATGYLIYRSTNDGVSFKYIGTSSATVYTDGKLTAGRGYIYKVCAYTLKDTIVGDFSPIADTSTNAAKVVLKYKAGDQKVRLTWNKVEGASSYDIYIGDTVTGFTLLTSSKTNGSYIAEGLVTGNTYSFYAVARRNYKGVSYDSQIIEYTNVLLGAIAPTSTTAKYFKEEVNFLNSNAYKQIPFFSQNVNYADSMVIPGLITTNVGGFTSTSMCPQGITFAKDYLLMTAYDMKDEENSVIYVMDKNTKTLLTTLVLPSKTHAGGIAFDGVNIWVPTGKKISSIPFTQVEDAVTSGNPYAYVTYNTTSQLDITASYLTYYDKKLWIGTYNELETTYLKSYTIEDKKSAPSLIWTETINMPTRVQGVAFTKIGTLILSRSCQLYKGLRGYIRQLELYKPDFEGAVDGVIPIGECINTLEVPSMNEGIAIDGSNLYVVFESAAFANASYKMDRICSFKLSSLVKKTV